MVFFAEQAAAGAGKGFVFAEDIGDLTVEDAPPAIRVRVGLELYPLEQRVGQRVPPAPAWREIVTYG